MSIFGNGRFYGKYIHGTTKQHNVSKIGYEMCRLETYINLV